MQVRFVAERKVRPVSPNNVNLVMHAEVRTPVMTTEVPYSDGTVSVA